MTKLTITNPADDSIVEEVEADTPSTVNEKAARARAAQPTWARLPLTARCDAIKKFGELMAARADDLALTTTRETGKPISQAKNELSSLQARIDFFLQQTPRVIAEKVVHSEGDLVESIAFEPLGVVANISAWNYPYFVGANVFVPALLTGNAVLYKPSEFATLTGLGIAKALHDAGIPQDVLIPVIGAGDVGAALLDCEVDGVFFTGSHATGSRVAAAVRHKMMVLQLELGGKDPAYVAADADLSRAAASTADGAFYNTGQSCCAVERIYVHEDVHDKFVEAFVKEVKSFVVGSPEDKGTYIGPLTRSAQLSVLEAQVADARSKGGQVVLGGGRLARKGNYFAPTVVTQAKSNMTIMKEESFGPVIGICKVASDEEASEKMNDTRYGLTAAVYSQSEARARQIFSRLRVGSVYWNCCDRVSPRLPWSGRGDSGMGVTLSEYGILTFTKTKAHHLRRV